MSTDPTIPRSPESERPQGALDDARQALSTRALYEQHRDWVWRSLQRLGANNALDDLFQEVFIVVHQRLSSYTGAGSINSWLYGICVRVVSAHRRKAHVRREQATDEMPEAADASPSPERQVETQEARVVVQQILDRLEPEKRAVFVMFELEQLSCQQIAAQLEIPVGTVYSRLHNARQEFQEAADKWSRRNQEHSR